MSQRPLTSDDHEQLRGAIDDGVDEAELRAITQRLLREGAAAVEISDFLEQHAPESRANNDEMGESIVLQIAAELTGDDSLALEEAAGTFAPVIDNRIRMEEPPPVRLVTVDDASLRMSPGLEPSLDDFYVTLLEFEKEQKSPPVYRAENYRLRFVPLDPLPARADMKPLAIEVRSLRDAEAKLLDREIEYEWERGLVPGDRRLLLRDPAANLIHLVESAAV
jgi:hypothetical protein